VRRRWDRLALLLLPLLGGCKSTPSSVTGWSGTPVLVLDQHPVLSGMQVVKTIAGDGTEIRNYVGKNAIASCPVPNADFSTVLSPAAYNTFSQCLRSHPACINVFYIEKGVITAFTPIGTGGSPCPADDRLQPNYHGP
jgi:hypothetical protein